MRIAVTGAHGSGKTTLIEDFLVSHPDYLPEQEPYWALAQQGVVFADGPNIADLEQQLDYSVAMILERAAEPNVVFDRCPIDFLAYLEVIGHREGFEWTPSGRQLARVEAALAGLDLLAFLPLTRPDEITTKIEYPRLRTAVDRELKSILRDDALELFASTGPHVVEIQGTHQRRLSLLEAAIQRPR